MPFQSLRTQSSKIHHVFCGCLWKIAICNECYWDNTNDTLRGCRQPKGNLNKQTRELHLQPVQGPFGWNAVFFLVSEEAIIGKARKQVVRTFIRVKQRDHLQMKVVIPHGWDRGAMGRKLTDAALLMLARLQAMELNNDALLFDL